MSCEVILPTKILKKKRILGTWGKKIHNQREPVGFWGGYLTLL